MSEQLQAVLDRLENVSGNNGEFSARCPCHEDNQNSLCVGTGDDGRVLLKCQANCETKDILLAVGLSWSDLFADEKRTNGDKKSEIVATYDYRDSTGMLLYQSVRMEPKTFRQRKPKPSGGWEWKLNGVRRVLYRLPELIAADSQQTVFIVEGEKDCDRLHSIGLVGTCNVGGAGKWKNDYNGPLENRHVVIIPDNDTPGRKHANQVAGFLQGVASSVRVLELPGLPKSGDVSDFLDNGGSRDELLRLAEDAAAWKPTDENGGESVVEHVLQLETAVSIHSPKGRTETANGRRFAQQNGRNVRFCHPWGKWLGWDGKRWKPDSTGAMDRLAKRIVDQIWNEAQQGDSDTSRRFAAKSASNAGIRAMLLLAASEPGIPILPDALDCDPWLLNVQNGTIDLKTGGLREHRREDLITKICPVAFNPEAASYEWDCFLESIFDGDGTLVSFTQRLFGYCLTGDVREQILPILHGDGANGKTTLLNAIMNVVGSDYSIKLGRDFLLTKRQEGHATERMDLFGKRLAVCSETNNRRRLDEGLVKELCGGDTIRGRRMREDTWEYRPTHKIFLATNAKPTVKGTDHAIWRRLVLVPFDVQFWDPDKSETGPDELKQNKRLPEQLKAEAEGILSWMVKGCLDWQRDGLGNPPAVKRATAEYRESQDVLAEFIEERCCVGPQHECKASILYKAYQKWTEDNGERTMSGRYFGEALTERNFGTRKSNGVIRVGIELLDRLE